MGKLIDADELKDFFYYGENDKPIFDENTDEKIVRIIDEWPVARDQEKVVAELEEHFNATNDKGARLAYHHAIQIVKGGGVDA